MEIKRLEDELCLKSETFESKFRDQERLMTDHELKQMKLEEENEKFKRKITFLENVNKQISESHAYLKKQSQKLIAENQELTSKLSWLMNGNDTTGNGQTGNHETESYSTEDSQTQNEADVSENNILIDIEVRL